MKSKLTREDVERHGAMIYPEDVAFMFNDSYSDELKIQHAMIIRDVLLGDYDTMPEDPILREYKKTLSQKIKAQREEILKG